MVIQLCNDSCRMSIIVGEETSTWDPNSGATHSTTNTLLQNNRNNRKTSRNHHHKLINILRNHNHNQNPNILILLLLHQLNRQQLNLCNLNRRLCSLLNLLNPLGQHLVPIVSPTATTIPTGSRKPELEGKSNALVNGGKCSGKPLHLRLQPWTR